MLKLCDPDLGHAVMVGTGGILTEVYDDTSFRLAPCTESEALEMIDELKIAPVFNDYRGLFLDKQKLAQTVSKISHLACDLGDHLCRLDINPIVYDGTEWIALDIHMIFKGSHK